MKELEFGDRSGPKTVITLFAYGGVHSMATFCLVRDLQKAAFVAGRATRANETLTASGMPAKERTASSRCGTSFSRSGCRASTASTCWAEYPCSRN
jgi:hypothetical protein